MPTVWFRNTWGANKENLQFIQPSASDIDNQRRLQFKRQELGEWILDCEGDCHFAIPDNETNQQLLFGAPNDSPYAKCGINRFIVDGDSTAINPFNIGTKASAIYDLCIPAQTTSTIRLRLAAQAAQGSESIKNAINLRRNEADQYHESISPHHLSMDEKNVYRQALAGILWSKQFYSYDLNTWLLEHGCTQFGRHKNISQRNGKWRHMKNFHSISLCIVDPAFACQQPSLMLDESIMHPNGQIPAYEWNFDDVNPPVIAWAAMFVYHYLSGTTDHKRVDWLKQMFQKLTLNYTWWLIRKEREGFNLFEGGYLGLDNISVFDRSSPLPTGGYFEQADGTAWVALFSQNMLDMAMKLSKHDHHYEEMCQKFLGQYLRIASTMIREGDEGSMWDEKDGFFYDVLRLPEGTSIRLKVRSLVGVLPLIAVTVFDDDRNNTGMNISAIVDDFLADRPVLGEFIQCIKKPGFKGRRMTSILDETKHRRVLEKLLDPEEFFGDYGIRSLSKFHADNPYDFFVAGEKYTVRYLPGESDSGMFGGNSNWLGPIWMPINILVIRALLNYFTYHGKEFRVEHPTGSGNFYNLFEVAEDLAKRLVSVFLVNEQGVRPVFGDDQLHQSDPNWKDNILFYEYFHGDHGSGLGASHQTAWSGLVASLIWFFGNQSQDSLLEMGLELAIQRDREGEAQHG